MDAESFLSSSIRSDTLAFNASFTFFPQARIRPLNATTAFASYCRSNCCVMPVSPSIVMSSGNLSASRFFLLHQLLRLLFCDNRSACAPMLQKYPRPLIRKRTQKKRSPEGNLSNFITKMLSNNNNEMKLYQSTDTLASSSAKLCSAFSMRCFC